MRASIDIEDTGSQPLAAEDEDSYADVARYRFPSCGLCRWSVHRVAGDMGSVTQ